MLLNFKLHRIVLLITSSALLLVACGDAIGQLTVTLTPSNYNGYNIRCFGGKSGSIDVTVTGGTAPYRFLWTSGDSIEDLLAIPAGYYKLAVFDSNNLAADASITLTEPEALKVLAVPYRYPEGSNISCNQCYNGSIEVDVSEGVPPYTYVWNDSITTQDRSGLGAQNYQVLVTDANDCAQKSEPVFLKQPDSDDWKMGGNANTDPNSQYIGTSDNTDVVFKSNGAERIRLLGSGNVKLPSLANNEGYSLVVADSTGEMKVLTGGSAIPYYYENCPKGNLPWTFCGNAIAPDARLGTTNNHPLRLISNDITRMIFDTQGRVGIGTVPPASGPIGDYRLYVEDGIACRDVLVKPGPWPDYVFEEAYHLMPLSELKTYLRSYKHLPGIPSAGDVDTKGGIEIGDLQTQIVRNMEEQALYILQLKDELDELKDRVRTLEATK